MSRGEHLRAIAAAAAEVGSELSALDHGAGSWSRIAALEAQARERLAALPAEDRQALEPAVARGLASAWSAVEDLARARLGAGGPGR